MKVNLPPTSIGWWLHIFPLSSFVKLHGKNDRPIFNQEIDPQLPSI